MEIGGRTAPVLGGSQGPALSAATEQFKFVDDFSAWTGKTQKNLFKDLYWEEKEKDMSDRYAAYEQLKFDIPADRILRITMDAPGRLNAADETMHDELGRIWKDVEVDPDISVAILRGAGDAFSAGGDFGMIDEMIVSSRCAPACGKKPETLSTTSSIAPSRSSAPCTVPPLAPVWWPACWPIFPLPPRMPESSTATHGSASRRVIVPPRGPLLCGMAKAKYYLLLCEPVSGEEAERIGLVSMCVDERTSGNAVKVAQKLARGAPSAIRFTKYALNNWLRMMGPNFDTSLALEFLGFTGPEAEEGLASLREKRHPNFDPNSNL